MNIEAVGPGDKIVPCEVDYGTRSVMFVGGSVSVDVQVMVRHGPNTVDRDFAKEVAALIRSFGYRNVIVAARDEWLTTKPATSK